MGSSNRNRVNKILNDLSSMFESIDNKCSNTGCMKKEAIFGKLADMLDDFHEHMKKVHSVKDSKYKAQKSSLWTIDQHSINLNDQSKADDSNREEYESSEGIGFALWKKDSDDSSGHIKRKYIFQDDDYSGSSPNKNNPMRCSKYRKLDSTKRRDRLPSSGSSSEEEIKIKLSSRSPILYQSSTSNLETKEDRNGYSKRKGEFSDDDLTYSSSNQDIRISKYPKMDQIEGQRCGKEVHGLSRDLEEMQLKRIKN